MRPGQHLGRVVDAGHRRRWASARRAAPSSSPARSRDPRPARAPRAAPAPADRPPAACGGRRTRDNARVPNDRLLQVADPTMPMVEAFRMADQVLYQVWTGKTSLITTPGLIKPRLRRCEDRDGRRGFRVDGNWNGSGDGPSHGGRQGRDLEPPPRVVHRRREGRVALDSPATDLTLHEVNGAADAITRVAHPDANIIFGAVVDDALGDEVRVTVVAAGFDRVSPPSDNRFESRLSRLLEEPVRIDSADEPLPSDPARRRGRCLRHRRRAVGFQGLVRRGGGPGHPGLLEELKLPARAVPREQGRGG